MTTGSESSGKTDILLVEDNSSDAALILHVLKKANIVNRIHVLTDGAEIFDFLFRQGNYKEQPALSPETLILLSLNLKGLNGIEVLRKVKSDERSRAFPIIILTSSQEDRGVMESYKLGANACIVKPMDIKNLIEAVAELQLGWLLVSPNFGGKQE